MTFKKYDFPIHIEDRGEFFDTICRDFRGIIVFPQPVVHLEQTHQRMVMLGEEREMKRWYDDCFDCKADPEGIAWFEVIPD